MVDVNILMYQNVECYICCVKRYDLGQKLTKIRKRGGGRWRATLVFYIGERPEYGPFRISNIDLQPTSFGRDLKSRRVSIKALFLHIKHKGKFVMITRINLPIKDHEAHEWEGYYAYSSMVGGNPRRPLMRFLPQHNEHFENL